jgi:DNA-3-methyladenine glycosylase I
MPRKPETELTRCGWATEGPERDYHDNEWGTPVHDDRVLFEFLILEGAQAGLSWSTILNKRESYRKAFAGFDPAKVARFGRREVRRLLGDPGIVRNRMKIEAAISNAKSFLEVQEEFGTFDTFLWGFVGGAPKQNRWRRLSQIPAETEESRVLSKDLKQRGFSFVGPTICYAFMQAVGMVNDHVVGCFRHRELKQAGKRRRPKKRASHGAVDRVTPRSG